MSGYVGMLPRHRYVDYLPREPDNLPIVTNVTPPHIAHVRTFAWIIATVVLVLAGY